VAAPGWKNLQVCCGRKLGPWHESGCGRPTSFSLVWTAIGVAASLLRLVGNQAGSTCPFQEGGWLGPRSVTQRLPTVPPRQAEQLPPGSDMTVLDQQAGAVCRGNAGHPLFALKRARISAAKDFLLIYKRPDRLSLGAGSLLLAVRGTLLAIAGSDLPPEVVLMEPAAFRRTFSIAVSCGA